MKTEFEYEQEIKGLREELARVNGEALIVILKLSAAEQRNAELDLEWSRTITERGFVTVELEKAKRLLDRSATAMSAIRNNPSLVRDIDDFLRPIELAVIQVVDCGECPYITDGCHGTCEKSRPAFWSKPTESGASE